MNELKLSVTKKPDKRIKADTTDNGKLTEKHLKCGSLKGRKPYYSKELRCTFYLKPGISFDEVERKYIEAQSTSISRVKNEVKADLKD